MEIEQEMNDEWYNIISIKEKGKKLYNNIPIKEKKMIMEKICLVCNKEFKTNYSFKIYCSVECYRLGHNNKNNFMNRKKIFNIVCPICKKRFDATNNLKIFCSFKCMNEAQRYKRRNRNLYEGAEKGGDMRNYERKILLRRCNICNKEFETKNLLKKYCSYKCMRKASDIKRKDDISHGWNNIRVLRKNVINKLTGGSIICMKCGYNNERTFEIHHKNGRNGNYNNNNYILFKSILLMDYNKSIEEYEVLCANCHRIVTNENKKKT